MSKDSRPQQTQLQHAVKNNDESALAIPPLALWVSWSPEYPAQGIGW